MDASVQDTIRTALAAKATGEVGQKTVKPSGDDGVRVMLPLKFSLDVNVTFTNALF